jgi:ribonuclease D
LSARVSVPPENLVTPELVRRLCWDWQGAGDDAVGAPPAAQRLGGRSDEEERRISRASDDAERSDEEERRISHASDDTAKAIDEFLTTGQARRWQRELVVPVLAAALQTTPDDVSPAAP